MFGKLPTKTLLLFIAAFLTPIFCLAYSESVTHPGLAGVSVDIYNKGGGQEITSSQKEYVVQGSIDEDWGLRSSNHFYDPVHNIGWNYYYSTINWANGDIIENQYSWPKAIQYYAEGNERMAFLSLGHLLHLIEDMTVPDHTRNDSHLPPVGSVYEQWVKLTYNQDKIVSKFSKTKTEKNWIYNDYVSFLIGLSLYSNNNYFSNNTFVNNIKEKYKKPEIIYEDLKYAYGVDESFKDVHKLLLKVELKGENSLFDYSLLYKGESEQPVLSDYFDRLGTQAVLAGVNVIDLFIKEGEKARVEYLAKKKKEAEEKLAEQNRRLEEYENSGLIGSFFVGLKYTVSDSLSAVGSGISGASKSVYDFSTVVASWSWHNTVLTGSVGYYAGTVAVDKTVVAYNTVVDTTLKSARYIGDVWNNIYNYFSPTTTTKATQTASVLDSFSDTYNTDGEVVITEGTNNQNETSNEIISIEQKVIEPNTDPQVENIIQMIKGFLQFNSQNDNQNTNAITQQNNSTPSIVIGNGFVTSGVSVSQTNGNILSTNQNSTTSTSTISVSLPPSLVLTKNPCDTSVSPNKCISLSSTTEISWFSTSTESIDYVVNVNGVISTTTDTSISLDLTENQYTNFSISAVSRSNGDFTRYNLSIKYVVHPIIINEIAWSGTFSDSRDQWLELLNTTDSTINLDNWTIENSSSTLSIRLSGLILPNDYFLVERKLHGENDWQTEAPISDIAPDNWSDWGDGLSTYGEELYLKDGAGGNVIDRVPYCENWCGFGGAGWTAERYDNSQGSDFASDWNINSDFNFNIVNGMDYLGMEILGTPKKRNSFSYLINKGSDVDKEVRLEKNRTYITRGDLRILPEGRLIIEEGNTIKIPTGAIVDARGPIFSWGNETSPVVFTVLADDEYGGKTIDDDFEGELSVGDYADFMYLRDEASNSEFTNTVFRYLKQGIFMSGVSDVSAKHIKLDHINDGFLFNDGSQIYIEDLVINAFSGTLLTAYGGSSLFLKNIDLSGVNNNLSYGLYMYDNSKAEIEGWEQRGGDGMCVAYNSSTFTVDNANLFDQNNSNGSISIYDNSKLRLNNSKLFQTGGVGISLYRNSLANISNSIFSSGDIGLLIFNDSTGNIFGSEFSNFSSYGINAYDNTIVSGEGLKIHDNFEGLTTWLNSSDIRISTSSLYSNTNFAIRNYLPMDGDMTEWKQVTALNNWWSDPSGPFNEHNPTGLGNAVSDGVTFDPWYKDEEMTLSSQDSAVISTSTDTLLEEPIATSTPEI